MSSNNISLQEGALENSCEVLSNKETQTSSAYITDSFALIKGPSRPLPKGINKSNAEVKVDNLLDCRFTKDPSDSKQITLTESFIKDIANVSTSETSESPRQTYCKEVVKPYLKLHLNDCEDNVDSLEKLIQDALEDFPDYQPCNEVYEGKKDIQEKTIGRTKKSRKMADNLQDTPPKDIPTNKKYHEMSEDQSPPLLSSRSSSSKVNKDTKNPAYSDNVQLPAVAADECVINEPQASASSRSLTKCVKESITALKRTASSCIERIEIVIGIKKPEKPGEKPTYYAIEKPKLECSTVHNVQTETSSSLKSLKNLLNSNNEKITVIKDKVKDIAGKFYKTSKDAVTLITSESARLLSKENSQESGTENRSRDKPERPAKKLRNISADSLASFFFKKAENKPIIDELSDVKDPESSENNPSLPVLAPGNIIGKIKEDIVNSRFDKSSTLDTPLPKEISKILPESVESRIPTVSAIDRAPDPPSASNMFTIIKSKIFSIFRDNSNETQAETQSNQDDDDEYPFEKYMEQ